MLLHEANNRLKTPITEEQLDNFTISKSDNNTYLVRGDSERFGENAILFESYKESDCEAYIMKHFSGIEAKSTKVKEEDTKIVEEIRKNSDVVYMISCVGNAKVKGGAKYFPDFAQMVKYCEEIVASGMKIHLWSRTITESQANNYQQHIERMNIYATT